MVRINVTSFEYICVFSLMGLAKQHCMQCRVDSRRLSYFENEDLGLR